MIKILVIADTHGYMENFFCVLDFEKPDYVIHAGDYCVPKKEMENNFDYYVDGNNDYQHVDQEIFIISGYKILLVHGHKQFNHNIEKWHENLRRLALNETPDIIIYGHSHKEILDLETKPYIINPGSLSLPRNKQMKKSYIVIEIKDKKINFDVKYL